MASLIHEYKIVLLCFEDLCESIFAPRCPLSGSSCNFLDPSHGCNILYESNLSMLVKLYMSFWNIGFLRGYIEEWWISGKQNHTNPCHYWGKIKKKVKKISVATCVLCYSFWLNMGTSGICFLLWFGCHMM